MKLSNNEMENFLFFFNDTWKCDRFVVELIQDNNNKWNKYHILPHGFRKYTIIFNLAFDTKPFFFISLSVFRLSI